MLFLFSAKTSLFLIKHCSHFQTEINKKGYCYSRAVSSVITVYYESYNFVLMLHVIAIRTETDEDWNILPHFFYIPLLLP